MPNPTLDIALVLTLAGEGHKIGYRHEDSVLSVFFKGGREYHYYEVPLATWQRFLVSESKGKFLNAEIKDKFQFEKVQA